MARMLTISTRVGVGPLRFAAAIGLVAATGGTQVRAQTVTAQTGVALLAFQQEVGIGGTTWEVRKQEFYNAQTIRRRLGHLYTAASEYANANLERYPAAASQLFVEGFATDPLLFYNPGDADAAPTTIDNDAPNGLNSARVSFDFPAAGLPFNDPFRVLFIDNTAANNAGLGRYAVFGDGHREFLSEHPHPFTDLHVRVRDPSETWIARRVTGFQLEPFSFDLPPGTSCEVVAAPHSFRLAAQGSVTQGVHDAFMSQGYGPFQNWMLTTAAATLTVASMQLTGPAGPPQPLVVYLVFSAVLSRPAAQAVDNAYLNVQAEWRTDSGFARDTAFVAATNIATFAVGHVAILEHRMLGPADEGYVPGAETVAVRGVAPLTIAIPVMTQLRFFVSTGVQASRSVFPDGALGQFAGASAAIDLPVTRSIDQVKVFVPAGYALSIDEVGGPSDLLLAVVRGDDNLDETIDAADQAAFVGAYTGPLTSVEYAPTDSGSLATFDFDGDADVDCVDHMAFKNGWSGGGEPAVFAACDMDGDGDGRPDGDDDCPATAAGTLVDQRGCPRGDFDGDADIDAEDWAAAAACMRGPFFVPFPPSPTLPAHCLNSFDRDGDGDVDLRDTASFLNSLTPP